MIYSEPDKGSDCLFPDQFSDFFGRGVRRWKNNSFKELFLQNNRFTSDLILQFSGVLRASNFDTYFRWFFKRNGLQMPLVARYCDHVGESGVLWDFARFFLSGGDNSGLRADACKDFDGKKKLPDFFLKRTNFFSIFCEPPKCLDF